MATATERRAQTAERRAEALKLRRRGTTYRQIAAQLGVSAQQAHRDVTQALRDIVPSDVAEDVRHMEADRLDGMLEAIWPRVEQGEPRAIEVALQLMARRAALLGLDAPKRTEAEVTVHDGDSDLDRRIADLMERMESRSEAQPEVESGSSP